MTEMAIRVNIPREMGWLERFEWGGTVILPAHVLEGIKKRAASMVRRLGCPYVIDPHTYVFGGDADEIAGKRWFDRLVAEYGLDTVLEPSQPHLSPDMLVKDDDPTDALRDFVQNVTRYQSSAIADASGEASEYEDFESDGGSGAPAPRWVVPPYFYIEGGGSDWLAVNVRSIELATRLAPGKSSLYSMIMVDQEALSDTDAVDEIVSAYRALPVAGHMVWVARMDEARARESELVYFQEFIGKISQGGKPVYNAYGGLFSLANDKISGTSHAICYGEHRNPFETAGAVRSARLYLPSLRSKVPYARHREVTRALELDECRCRWCKIAGAGKGMKELEHAALHFLECRTRDLAQIERAGGAAFLDRLKSACDRARGSDAEEAYAAYYAHFETWHRAAGLRDGRTGG